MPDPRPIENDFVSQVTAVIGKNLSNEAFGVSELAEAMNMSRSNLLRRVKKDTRLSVSQLISQVRLKHAMELLRKSSLNVSEVSHEVGFGSTSYFIKCFREYYGYPPGEVGKRSDAEMPVAAVPRQSARKRNYLIGGVIGLILISAGLFAYYSLPSGNDVGMEKSIVVLPFINDSNDSTNLYFINGLMDATLNNLEKIGDLSVVSRTSSEKYRDTGKSVPEIAGELGVNYVVEGSGQKIGDQILLNIQLIEASTDRHLWSEQYRRQMQDVFELQQEIAKDIAGKIEVRITPEEAERIDKVPTDNIVAYDFFLKGKDLFYQATTASLEASLPYFRKAIEHDTEFALAYATAAQVFYYLDMFDMHPRYGDEIRNYADKALQFDSRSGESLIAKALSYAHDKQYEKAIPYFERALEYSPRSGTVLHFLTEFYHIHIPDPEKYLEYALRKMRLDFPSADSVTASHNYLQLSNAFMQTGFIDEALLYADKSIAYNPRNEFIGSLRAFLLFIQNKDIDKMKDRLVAELEKDTTRFDVLMHVGKTCYTMGDYENAYRYLSKFMEKRKNMHLDVFKDVDLTMAIVLSRLGRQEEAKEYFRVFKAYTDNDQSIYKNMNLALYYAATGQGEQAIKYFELFSEEDNFVHVVLLVRDDPVVDFIKDRPEFRNVMQKLETKFWNTNKRIRKTMEEKELL